MSAKRFNSFEEFYPFYLGEHSNKTCRRLHIIGTFQAIIQIIRFVLTGNPICLLQGLIAAYAFAWVGHFFFEKNRPATFQYPLYSFMGDWRMFFDTVTGKLPF
jgi:hypothetical protein